MKIEYEVTLEDLIYFNKYHFLHSEFGKKTLLKRKIIYTVFFIFFGIIYSLITGLWLIFLSLGIILSVIFLFLSQKLYIRRLEKNTLKLLKDDNNKEMLGRQSIEIHEDGIIVKGQLSEGKTLWGGILKVEEDSVYAFIYLASIKAYAIRKSSITFGEIETFLKVIREKIKQAD